MGWTSLLEYQVLGLGDRPSHPQRTSPEPSPPHSPPPPLLSHPHSLIPSTPSSTHSISTSCACGPHFAPELWVCLVHAVVIRSVAGTAQRGGTPGPLHSRLCLLVCHAVWRKTIHGRPLGHPDRRSKHRRGGLKASQVHGPGKVDGQGLPNPQRVRPVSRLAKPLSGRDRSQKGKQKASS